MARRSGAATTRTKAQTTKVFEQDDSESEEDEWAIERQRQATNSNAERTTPNDQHDDSDDDDDDDDDEDVIQQLDDDVGDELDDGVGMYEDDQGEALDSEDEGETLNKQISAIPFGSLLKAKKQLNGNNSNNKRNDKGKQRQVEQDQDNDGQDEVSSKRLKSWKRGGNDTHRSNKHAQVPMEMSSKKPVSRHRQIAETKTIRARDPRFDSLSGGFKPDLFQNSYGFLKDKQTQELDELRKTANLARKNKLLPQEEKNQIETALTRMQSKQASRQAKERDDLALRNWKKQEQEKRQQGKKEFYLKDSDKKKLQLKAKFDDLAQDKKQLRKAIEKKRRKMAQKDKKSMPNRR
ncbi:rRNA biogenesis protein rrp36 [Microbotryomycetes sp. JL221]|nr:rRNA biogenesis protein rrp36 [Microbotryomycetes sp. JL221]